MDARPIGMFDSGVGGLSVWREVQRLLPEESVLYYADSAHCPYGTKSPQEITRLSSHIVDFLIARGCKLVIVACNTATSAAIPTLRAHYALPIVGMEPAIKPAAQRTRTGHIGVLATEGTLKGEKYKALQERFARSIQVHVQVGQGLVELVEQGREDSPEARALLWSYLEPMLASRVDQIVLGCTHYPFLREQIESLLGKRAEIHDPAPAVARRTAALLDELELRAPQGVLPAHGFYTSGNPEQLRRLVEKYATRALLAKGSQVEDGLTHCRYDGVP